MVASTNPSTTKVSQSVISTPLSLMLGPTVSLLPPSLTVLTEAAGSLAALATFCWLAVWEADYSVPDEPEVP